MDDMLSAVLVVCGEELGADAAHETRENSEISRHKNKS